MKSFLRMCVSIYIYVHTYSLVWMFAIFKIRISALKKDYLYIYLLVCVCVCWLRSFDHLWSLKLLQNKHNLTIFPLWNKIAKLSQEICTIGFNNLGCIFLFFLIDAFTIVLEKENCVFHVILLIIKMCLTVCFKNFW